MDTILEWIWDNAIALTAIVISIAGFWRAVLADGRAGAAVLKTQVQTYTRSGEHAGTTEIKIVNHGPAVAMSVRVTVTEPGDNPLKERRRVTELGRLPVGETIVRVDGHPDEDNLAETLTLSWRDGALRRHTLTPEPRPPGPMVHYM